MKFKHAGQQIKVYQRNGRWYYEIEGSGMSGPALPCSKEKTIDLAKKVAETHGQKAIRTDGETSR